MDTDEVTIVVVEDEPNIADLLDLYLRRAGYRVVLAPDGDAALTSVERHRPRLVVLDIGLPGALDGLEVCRRIRGGGAGRASDDVPIVFLTARDDEVDRVVGLELGADDYVTKPFSAREVVARVKAILRRADTTNAATNTRPAVHRFGNVDIDTTRREAKVDGAAVELTPREFDLLAYLADHAGMVLSRRQLLDGAWGAGWVGDERTVDVHVAQLRKKLGDGLDLATVRGAGYRLG
jgi:DNA-binding response OmpR family regulator